MSDKKWERYAAFGGVLFVVLNVIAAAITGKPPAADDSAAEIAKYIADYHGALRAAAVLGGVGSVGLIWWFGSLWRRMADAEGGHPRLAVVSAVGLTLGGGLFLASTAVAAAAALRIDDLGEGSMIFWVLNLVLLSGAGFGMATHLLATNALAVRTRMFPMWIVAVGMLSGLGFIVSAVIGVSSTSFSASIIGIISFLAWSVWILAVSFTMWRTVDAAPAAA